MTGKKLVRQPKMAGAALTGEASFRFRVVSRAASKKKWGERNYEKAQEKRGKMG